MLKIKDYIFILLVVGVVVILFITTDKYDKVLAFIGAITALISVLFTTIVNNNRINLEREKIQLQVTENITKDTYRELFNKKIALYQELNKRVSKYFDKVNSAIFDDYYEEQGMYINRVHNEETIFMDEIREMIKLLKDNELLVSKEIYAHYSTLNDLYLLIKKQFDEFMEFEFASPEDYEDKREKVSKLFYENANKKFEYFKNQLDQELDTIRDKIEF